MGLGQDQTGTRWFEPFCSDSTENEWISTVLITPWVLVAGIRGNTQLAMKSHPLSQPSLSTYLLGAGGGGGRGFSAVFASVQ